ncbi:resolvase [Listeria ivanovii]|uniref:recombinase family protein n=1 Tax=Listeria ivanovii TaxID=1638 RepID=UPI000DA811E7|nr:recombinase family protein [Listeria ivanovii]PZF87828.1 resolvase [Listeria ivanovii]PZF92985.1 resolvase [Listeria ivanovii]PZG03896.1 resolvase [Listeria ivanovii]PZG08294.1 resolvase [Listeria ivanovii]PZG25140.1 resolvase [Listeria ivanovii]
MNEKIGYARVSTRDQKLDLQIDALKRAGCNRIFKEKQSGRITKRAELDLAMKTLKPGDTFVVYKLDRLGRTTRQLLELIEELRLIKVDFVSVQDNIDTSSSMGRFIFTVMSAFAEMEADLIRERTMAGLESARKKGNIGGRPKLPEETVKEAIALYSEGNTSIQDISARLNIARSTLYRYLKKSKIR